MAGTVRSTLPKRGRAEEWWADTRTARAPNRFFVIPDRRLVFVTVAKNACTSVKWLLAEIAGEDLDGFVMNRSPQMFSTEAIHTRTQWRRALNLSDVRPEVRAQIHPNNGWFIFAVVRDPRTRLFSAWQEKFLLHNPRYTAWRSASWYPRLRPDADTVVEDFAAFVAEFDSNPDHPLLRLDTHFKSQVRLIRPSLIPYSRIYDIRELDLLRADLAAHLASTGWERPIQLRTSNGTALRATGAAFPPPVQAAVERIYARDFKAFAASHGWDFTRIAGTPAWGSDQLAEAGVRAELAWQIGDYRDSTLRLERELRELRAQHRREQTRRVGARLRRGWGRTGRRIRALRGDQGH